MSDYRAATSLSLAEDLLASGDYAGAALEYRRLAADLGPDNQSTPGLLLSAADAYRQAGDTARMARMLSRLDGVGLGKKDDSVLPWLRMRLDEERGHWASAMLYAEELRDVATVSGDATLRQYATRSLAADAILAGSYDDAVRAVSGDATRESAIERYIADHDKSPRVGGLLGLIPGMGYAYSGEWGNMFRSIFLNGIFGWAMYETADRDQWGLFAVSTFFELTWYTGSIYGGIDAAHRHNKERLDATVRELRGDDGGPRIERDRRVDLFSLKLAF